MNSVGPGRLAPRHTHHIDPGILVDSSIDPDRDRASSSLLHSVYSAHLGVPLGVPLGSAQETPPLGSSLRKRRGVECSVGVRIDWTSRGWGGASCPADHTFI